MPDTVCVRRFVVVAWSEQCRNGAFLASVSELTSDPKGTHLVSIYDSIGGSSAVRAAVDAFYARVLADPQLAPFFTSTDLQHLKAHQRAFIAAAIGGPEIYQGRDMAAAHAGMAVTEADFDGVVAHLVDTLAGLGVPEETIGQIGGALAPLRGEIVTAPAVQLAG